MKQLQLGKITSRELADWFGYTYNFFKSKKKSQVMPFLKDYCEVVYLPRTEGISTTKIKQDLGLNGTTANK